MFQGLKFMTSVAVPVFDRSNETVSLSEVMLSNYGILE